RLSVLCAVVHTDAPFLGALSLHDALPILTVDDIYLDKFCSGSLRFCLRLYLNTSGNTGGDLFQTATGGYIFLIKVNPRRKICLRSEEHTSELQSREKLVCRLLLEERNGAV